MSARDDKKNGPPRADHDANSPWLWKFKSDYYHVVPLTPYETTREVGADGTPNVVIQLTGARIHLTGYAPIVTVTQVALPAPVPLPRLRRILTAVFPSKFYACVVQQTIADMDVEYREAQAAGHSSKANWVVVCAVLSIGNSIFKTVVRPILDIIHELLKPF